MNSRLRWRYRVLREAASSNYNLYLQLLEKVEWLYAAFYDSLLNSGAGTGLLSTISGPLDAGAHTLSFSRQGLAGLAVVGGDPAADFFDVGFVSDLENPEGSFLSLLGAGDSLTGQVIRLRDDGSLAVIGEFNIQVSSVPEPSLAGLFFAGLTLVALRHRSIARRKRTALEY